MGAPNGAVMGDANDLRRRLTAPRRTARTPCVSGSALWMWFWRVTTLVALWASGRCPRRTGCGPWLRARIPPLPLPAAAVCCAGVACGALGSVSACAVCPRQLRRRQVLLVPSPAGRPPSLTPSNP